MNGLILFLGESFRTGGQASRIRGNPDSYKGQMEACKTHIAFIEHIQEKYKMSRISVYISSYTTPYDTELLKIYEKYLIGQTYGEEGIGINNLFHNAIRNIDNIGQYDFILYMRIDLFLKPYFSQVFDPTRLTIQFPHVCWFQHHRVDGSVHPRVSDAMLFIPRKYFNYLNFTLVCHDVWHIYMKIAELLYDDLDVMIDTYHDSNTASDKNPIYYICNRDVCDHFHSEGHIFDKNEYIRLHNIVRWIHWR